MIFSSNTRLLQPDDGFCSMHATCKRESNTLHMIPSGASQHQTSQTWKRRNLREEILELCFVGWLVQGNNTNLDDGQYGGGKRRRRRNRSRWGWDEEEEEEEGGGDDG
jgi:hypothetical protein